MAASISGSGVDVAVGAGAGAVSQTSVRRLPAGSVPIVGMGRTEAAAAASEVRAFVDKVQVQVQLAYWARRSTIELPRLEAHNEQVLALAQATRLTPEQVVERFGASAHALDTCARTLARVKQFEAENEGKLPPRMRDTIERLSDFANTLCEYMSVFQDTKAADAAMCTIEDSNDADGIAEFRRTHSDYTKKARRALGIANFDKTVAEAIAAMEALQETAAAKKDKVTEEELVKAWAKADQAIEQIRAAQEVVDQIPVSLKAAARKKGKSAIVRLIGKKGKGLSKLVRSTARGKGIKQALEASREIQKAEEARVARETAQAAAQGQDPSEVVKEAAITAAAHNDAIEKNIAKIEADPSPEFTPEELSSVEREIAAALEAALLAKEDGVSRHVKQNLIALVTRGFHLKRSWADKDPTGIDAEALATDPDLFDMAQLVIEVQELYYDANRALDEVTSDDAVYLHRLPLINDGVMKTYELAWKHLVIEPLSLPTGGSILKDLFELIDQDRGDGEGSGDLTDRVEAAHKKAWELYFSIVENRPPDPRFEKREDVYTFITGERMFPDA